MQPVWAYLLAGIYGIFYNAQIAPVGKELSNGNIEIEGRDWDVGHLPHKYDFVNRRDPGYPESSEISQEEGSEGGSHLHQESCLRDGQYCNGWSASNPFASKQCCGALVCGTNGATLTQWVCQRACANCGY